MIKTKRVPELMNQNAPDVGDGIAVSTKSQCPAIRIEILAVIKQDIGLAHRAT
jgi:hypothetical protein